MLARLRRFLELAATYAVIVGTIGVGCSPVIGEGGQFVSTGPGEAVVQYQSDDETVRVTISVVLERGDAEITVYDPDGGTQYESAAITPEHPLTTRTELSSPARSGRWRAVLRFTDANGTYEIEFAD